MPSQRGPSCREHALLRGVPGVAQSDGRCRVRGIKTEKFKPYTQPANHSIQMLLSDLTGNAFISLADVLHLKNRLNVQHVGRTRRQAGVFIATLKTSAIMTVRRGHTSNGGVGAGFWTVAPETHSWCCTN